MYRTESQQPPRGASSFGHAALLAAFAWCVAVGGAIAQPGFIVAVQANQPGTFSSSIAFPGGGSPNQIVNLIRTETLSLTLQSTPTVPGQPPTQLVPRRLQLWLGAFRPIPLAVPEGLIWVDPAGAVPLTLLLDSFSNPFGPTFGPPLSGPSNTINLPLGLNFFGPGFPLPSGPLCVQGFCEDLPGLPVILSNPVVFSLDDPQTNFAPTIADIQPVAPTGLGVSRPQGPETGGNTVTLTGTNFPFQSDWITYPPTILFGTQPATNVIITSTTTLVCTVPPVAAATAPPATSACLVDVVYVNNPQISPLAAPALSPIRYLYLSGVTPTVAGVVPPNGTPLGGTPLTINGTNFLNGAIVRFRSVANASLFVDLPATSVGAGGASLTVISPIFCTGPVTLQIINCDEVLSPIAPAPVVYTYDPVPPLPTAATPLFVIDPRLGGGSVPAITDVGSALTIAGTSFFPASSPVATAPTILPGSFFPTRIRIDGILQPGIVPASTTQLTGTTENVDQSGLFRDQLGCRTVTVENAPCFAVGNAAPIVSPLPPPPAVPCQLLRQDQNPPVFSQLAPSISSVVGCGKVQITGGNFFSLQNGTTFQDFGGGTNIVTAINLLQMRVPAVLFGTRFAPRVTLIDGATLEVEVPPSVGYAPGQVPILVFNPDGRVSNAGTFRYVPTLTDVTRSVANAPLVLDGPGLLQILAQGAVFDEAGAPAITVIRNPSPGRDRARDPAAIGSSVSYDVAFLFNTRRPSGAARFFNFAKVDLPDTITLPANFTGQSVLAPFDRLLEGGGTPPAARTVPIPGGTTLRVIVKAMGFDFDPVAWRFVFDEADNHPFFLQSHSDLLVDGFVQLSGDCFFVEALANVSRFRVRVDRTYPPAGAGRGGRGGAYFAEGLLTLPGPNFGVSPNDVRGFEGSRSPGRSAVGDTIATSGRGGFGNSPVGVQAGGGGGAGHSSPGAPGLSGTAPGGIPGGAIGNAATSSPNAGLNFGAPTDERLVYGNAAADFALPFANDTAVQSGAFYGGSGGGGGGGGLAIFVPSLTLGGRGGNGGGSLVLVANCVLEIGCQGALFARGEAGQLGVDAFPAANADPSNPVNLPGGGGGGSGGTIVGFAIVDVDFDDQPIGVPACTTPTRVSTQGGSGTPAPSGQSIFGGAGAPGRVRFAVNQFSSGLAAFQARLGAIFSASEPVVTPPANAAGLPNEYFFYFSP